MHNSYFDPKKIELRAFREQAEKRLRDNNLFPSEDTIIHYQAFGEQCTRTVNGKLEYLQHEVYSHDPNVVNSMGATSMGDVACKDDTCKC